MSFTDAEVHALRAIAQTIIGLMNANGGAKPAATAGKPVSKPAARQAAGTSGEKPGGSWKQEPASDDVLDGQWGDPQVRRDPKRWAGDSMIGRRYSECPSDYLITLAEQLEYGAGMDSKKPDPPKHEKSGKPWFEYNRIDASKARGWALRNLGKSFEKHAEQTSDADTIDPMQSDVGDSFGGDDIPF